MGSRQSGKQLYRLADLDRDFDLFGLAINYARNIINNEKK